MKAIWNRIVNYSAALGRTAGVPGGNPAFNNFLKYSFSASLILLTLSCSVYTKISALDEFKVPLFVITLAQALLLIFLNRIEIPSFEIKENKFQSRKFLFNMSIDWKKVKFFLTKHHSEIFLTILILVGVLLRFFTIGFLYNVDEAISGIAAQGIVHTGYPVMPSGVVYGREFLSTYLISLGIFLFGFNELGLRITALIFGTAVIFLSYLLGQKILTYKFGLLFAAIIALSGIEILYSGFARMYIFFQFFFLLNIIFSTYFLINKDKKFYFFIGSVTTALLCFFSHRSGIIVFLIPISLFLMEYGRFFLNFKYIKYLGFSFLFIIVASAMEYQHIQHFFEIYIYAQNSTYDFSALASFSNFSNSYILISREIGFPALVLLGSGYLFSWFYFKNNRKLFCLLSIPLILLPLIVDLTIYSQGFTSRIRYIVFLMPVFLLFTSFGIVCFTKIFKFERFVILCFLIMFFVSGYLVPSVSEINTLVARTGEQKEIFLNEINGLINKNNLLLIGSPPELLLVNFKQPDYWLVSNPSEIHKYSINSEYQYIHVPILSKQTDLNVIDHARGVVIVMEKNRWQFINKATANYIKDTYYKYKGFGDDKYDIYFSQI